MSSAEEGTPSYLQPSFSSPSSPSHQTRPHRLLLTLLEAGKARLLSLVHSIVFFFHLIWIFFFYWPGIHSRLLGEHFFTKHHILTIAQLWLIVPVGVPGKHISGTEAFSPTN